MQAQARPRQGSFRASGREYTGRYCKRGALWCTVLVEKPLPSLIGAPPPGEAQRIDCQEATADISKQPGRIIL